MKILTSLWLRANDTTEIPCRSKVMCYKVM